MLELQPQWPAAAWPLTSGSRTPGSPAQRLCSGTVVTWAGPQHTPVRPPLGQIHSLGCAPSAVLPSHHPARNIAGNRLPTKSQCLAPRPCLPPRRPAHPQVPPPSRASSLRGPTPCHPSSPHMGPLHVPTVCGVQAHLDFRGGGQPGAFWGGSLVAPAPRGQGGGESCWGEGLPVSGDSDLRAELLREQGPRTGLPS